MAYTDLRDYLATLERNGKLLRISAEVDNEWEIAAVTRRVFQRIPEADRPGLLFEHVKNFDMPVTVGVLGASREVYATALQCKVEDIPDVWAEAQQHPVEPEVVPSGPVKEQKRFGEDVDVTRLPASVWTVGQDAGRFLTAPCVISEDPDTGERNVGTYRIQLKSPRRVGLQLSNRTRDMWTHISKNEARGRNTPCAIVLGGDPTVGLTSVSRVAYGLDELSVAGGLRGDPLEIVACETVDLKVPARAEIVIEGEVLADVREDEGPFGEYTGYMSDSGPSYVIQVNAITHRTNPIFHDFFSQMPPSESSTIRGTGREMAIYKHLTRDLRMDVTDVHFLHAGGGAAILAISMRKKFDGQALAAMWGAWSVDPSLGKFTVVVDDDIEVRDTFQVLWAMSWHVRPDRDIQVVQQTPPTPLDPAMAPADAPRDVRRGQLSAKVGIDATRKHAYPARAIPPREHLEEVDRRWASYGLDAKYLSGLGGAR
ncbi:MAG TPA: UbiD family decarboxylase [Chloroflexota bacterium]